MLVLACCGSRRAEPPPPSAPAQGPDLELFAGPHTTCLREDAALECWGENHTAQLGDVGEACEDSRCLDRARFMPELGAVRSLAIGDFHACVLSPEGDVACLGADHYGQLAGLARSVCGVGGYVVPQAFLDVATGRVVYRGTQEVARVTLACATSPVPIEAMRGASLVYAGGASTCVRRGERWLCAGANLEALGVETMPDRCGSYDDPCARRVLPVLAGRHVDELDIGTSGACWRAGSSAQCAGGRLEVIGRSDDVAQITVGHQHACMLHRGGAVECGGWNAEGSIGNGQTTEPAAPSVPPVRVLERARSVVAGSGHTCAIRTDDSLYCWGTNPVIGTNPARGRLHRRGTARDRRRAPAHHAHACRGTAAGSASGARRAPHVCARERRHGLLLG